MSKKLIILVSFVLVLGLAVAAPAGLVGHWKFDEGSGTIAADSSGKGRDGTISGAEWTSPGWDGTGYCLDFDGQGSDRVSLGTFDVAGDAISIACWFKADNLDTPGNDPRMISKAIGGNNEEHWFMVSSSRQSGIKVLRFRLKTDGTTDEIKADTTTGTIELDVWIHVAVTWDGSTMRIYKNGVEVGSLAKGGTLSTDSTVKVAIGNQPAGTGGDRPFDGLIDEVLICDRAMSAAQVQDLVKGITPSWAKARDPIPADGAIYEDTWASLSWTSGDDAASHDVYFGDNFDNVNDGTADTFKSNQTGTLMVIGFPGFPFPDGLMPGTTYFWRIDELEADGTTKHKGNVWSFTIPPKKAHDPKPADNAKFVDMNVELSWTEGFGAKLHHLYFGDNFDDVNDGVVGLPHATTAYTPGPLELEKTYYWRIDEFDGLATHKGDVWTFRTIPIIAITDPNLVGWWKLDEGMGTTAVDWSGHEHHGTISGPDWVAGYDGGALDFITGHNDRVSVGSFDVVGNGITMAAWINPRSFTVDDARIISKATSSDGNDHWWMLSTISDTGEIRLRFRLKTDDGQDTTTYIAGALVAGEWAHVAAIWDGSTMLLYKNGSEVGRTAKAGTAVATSPTVKVAIGNQPAGVGGGTRDYDGLIDDIRLYNRGVTPAEIPDIMRGDPRLAWDPRPANWSTPYIRDATPLNWSPGDFASQHDVYFGIDRDAVADADASDTTGIYRGRQGVTFYTPPEGVEWGGGPYYWRIDEYNTDGTISEGNVWSFTVADFIGIDDFEDYNDYEPDRIFDTWIDGWGIPTNGSTVGYPDPNFDQGEHFVETNIVHGGGQSMPFFYENNFKYSEATYSPAQRDWTEEGVGVLSLWFYGDASNAAERMYVALNGIAVVYHDNTNAAQINNWTQWTIDLPPLLLAKQDMGAAQGVNLANVNTISIGFGDKNNLQPGGSGLVFFDDIRLYQPAPEPEPAP